VTQIVKTIPIQIAIIVNRNCFCVMSKYRKINNNKGIAILILLIYLLLNSGSTGAYHSIMYGDFSMLIAGINILLSLSIER
jgi:hypothetical protein